MKISYRQLSIVVFMSFIALKLLSLPSFLYIESKNSAWLVALVLMFVDALYTFILIGLMKKSNFKNINEFMENTLGKPLTKIVLALLFIKFALTIANISKGLEFFVTENFYNDFSWSLFVFPLVILSGFMIYKGIRNISRVFEMFVWAILIGCIYIAVKSIPGVDPYIYLPFLKDGAMPLLSSAYTYIMWFGSSTFLIMLFGKVDFKDEKKSKMIIYIVLAIALVQFMYFVFYGLFDVTSPTHTFAVSDISQFSSGRSSIDELSWLVVSLWVVAQALQIALYGYCLMLTIMYLFNIKSRVIPIIIIDIYLILWSYLGANTINLEGLFFSDFVSLTCIITQYLIPLLLWVGYAVYNQKVKKLKGVKYERKTKTYI